MKANPSYSIDDLQGDLGSLCRLLEVTNDNMLDIDYGSGETRNHDLDRVAALVFIARNMAGCIERKIGEHYQALKGRPCPKAS